MAGAVLLGVMISPVVRGQIYTFNDLGDFHLPLRALYSQRLALGESFLWTPQLFCGYYVAGEGQVGMFHPCHLILYSLFPVWLAFALEAVASYPLMFAGAYFFLRRRILRREAAMFGSLLLTFCSFNLLHFVHINGIAVAAHIPWLLWATDVMLLDADRRRVVAAQVGIALLTGSQLLLGYPQYVWFSLLAETGYLLFLVAHPVSLPDGNRLGRPQILRRCLGWGLAKTAGLLLGGIQLFPTLDVLNDSVRHSVSAWYSNYGSLHPLNLLQLVAPYLFNTRVFGQNTHELGIYLGAVPLMLVLWSLTQYRHLGRLKPFYGATAAFGLLALWLAAGKYGQIYRLQRFLPIVGGFRCPCRYAMLFQFSVAVLGAIAFWLLLRQQERHEKTAWSTLRLLGIPVAFSAATILSPGLFPDWPYFSSWRALVFSPALMAGAALLVAAAARGSRTALVGLVLLTAADLGLYGFKHSVLRDTKNIHRFVHDVAVPQDRPDGRVLMNPESVGERGVHYGNAILLTGWSRADGYTGLEARRRLDYRQPAALRAAGVRWVLRNELTVDLPGLILRGDWLEVPDPLPRVFLATEARPSRNPAEDITRIPLETAALVESPLELPPGPQGFATLYGNWPGRLDVWVECSTPQLLVVSERYHPGWQAHVEGKPREVLRVNGDFLGCLVRPGEHRVALRFDPPSLRTGAMVSGLGLALVLLLSLPACCSACASENGLLRGKSMRTPLP